MAARLVTVLGIFLLSLGPVGEARGAGWDDPVTLGSVRPSGARGLVALSSSTLVALYDEHGYGPTNLFVRRSTDSGVNWRTPVFLTSAGNMPSIAGRGTKVDVVWVGAGGRIRYARSTNGGKSFASSVPLSRKGRSAWQPNVARGPDGVLAISWVEAEWQGGIPRDNSGVVRVRVSSDGGRSFAATQVLLRSTSHDSTSVAIGHGVVYVAYHVDHNKLRVKHSRDAGETWSAPVRITDRLFTEGTLGDPHEFQLTAAGQSAYLAYTVENSATGARVRYRRSNDRGAAWSMPLDIGPATWISRGPHISLRAGVVRAVFYAKCQEIDPELYWPDCRVFYRQSRDGKTWTAAQQVSHDGLREAYPAGVDFAGTPVVLYSGYDPDGWGYAFARAKAP